MVESRWITSWITNNSHRIGVKQATKETDARIVIDDWLRQAGWDPVDKSQVLTEVTVGRSFGGIAYPG